MSCKIASTVPLNGVEKYLCLHGGWVTIAHAAHLSGNYSKLINKAPDALQCLLKRHPRMRTRIRVDNDRYLLDFLEYDYEYLSSNILFSSVEIAHESWQAVVERRCNQDPYSNHGTIIFPLFHFMLLFNPRQSNDDLFHLILFENHCVSDGRSGLILINDFLTLATESNLSRREEPMNTENLPLIGQLIPRPYGPLYPLIAFVGKQIFKHELNQLIHPRIPIKVTPLTDCEPTRFQVQRYKNRFLFASSSSDLYSRLHQQSRDHEVTLNGPLLSCLLLAIHHCFPLRDPRQLKPFAVGVAFDMRARLPLSSLTSSSVGFFIAVGEVKLDHSLSMQSTRFWSLAHQCMTITRDQMKRDGIPLVMNVFADILGDEREIERVARLFPEGRQSEVGFSNIGKYPFSCEYNHGEVRLRGIHVVNNTSLYRSPTVIYITCAGDGQLDFSLVHEMESDDKAKEFLDFYLRLVNTCADNERCGTNTTLDELLKIAE